MLDISTISTMDADELLKAVVDMYDLIPADKAAARIKIKIRAKALGCLDDFEDYIKVKEKAFDDYLDKLDSFKWTFVKNSEGNYIFESVEKIK